MYTHGRNYSSSNGQVDSSVILWEPSPTRVAETKMSEYIKYVNKSQNLKLSGCGDLHTWTTQNLGTFWNTCWDFVGMIGDKGAPDVLNENDIFNAQFFPNGKINLTENILRRNDDSVAIVFYGEDMVRRELTWKDLCVQTMQLVNAFKHMGVKKNDVVAGVVANTPEAVIGHLATAAIGAIWSSCSPDFGVDGIKDRIGQLNPKVLMGTDMYYFKGKRIDVFQKLLQVKQEITSIQHLVVCAYDGTEISNKFAQSETIHKYNDVIAKCEKHTIFERFNFNDPMVVMFSSGTTGPPKCIVHRYGVLLQLMKEHQLHCDIKPGDKIFYYTTCGWMMWNWLVGALASEASLVLYDGHPFARTNSMLFDIASKEKVSFCGLSAKYIDLLRCESINFLKSHDLSNLRTIASTGSPLSPDCFQYIYNCVKKDVHLASISGGTDILSCFILGNPTGAVHAGEIQTKGLGMAVEVFKDDGSVCEIGEKGELVCTQPFVSRPVCFFNDSDNHKYKSAYFSRYPNTWAHGDFAVKTQTGGFVMLGRSDAVLNPGGVRIGTSEIYRVVHQLPFVQEAVCVGRNVQDDVHVVLFLQLQPHVKALTTDMVALIKSDLKNKASPRHVPSEIYTVEDIPKTRTGKIVEIAVKNIINGDTVSNVSALENPESLKIYEKFTRKSKL